MAREQVYSPGMFLVPQVGGHFFFHNYSTLILLSHQVARSCYTLRGQNLERFNHRGLVIEVHGLLCLIFFFFAAINTYTITYVLKQQIK